MGSHNAVRWVVALVVALGIVAMLAWRRNEPGVGDRFPGQSIEHVTSIVAPLESSGSGALDV